VKNPFDMFGNVFATLNESCEDPLCDISPNFEPKHH